MGQNETVFVFDVLAKAASNVHGNCSIAALHRLTESETGLFRLNRARSLHRTSTLEHGICLSLSLVLAKFATGPRME
jgi:hypothetical protein